jgi:hypothetical protein
LTRKLSVSCAFSCAAQWCAAGVLNTDMSCLITLDLWSFGFLTVTTRATSNTSDTEGGDRPLVSSPRCATGTSSNLPTCCGMPAQSRAEWCAWHLSKDPDDTALHVCDAVPADQWFVL